jgi:hypothetical protein
MLAIPSSRHHRQRIRRRITVDLGGLQTFAASAKLKGQREESGRSRYQPVFSIVLMQRRSAVSPLCEFGFLAACARSVGNAASV